MGDREAKMDGVKVCESLDTRLDEDDETDLRYGTWKNRAGLRAAVLRNKCLSGMVCMAFVAVVATIIASAGRRSGMRPAPANMCGGEEGNRTLRRLSREAYEFWASAASEPTDNLVIMLGDGYGPHYHAMARAMRRYQSGNASYMLPLDPFLVGGSITSASSNIITDSAAGATAYSVGRKTFNGALGVVPRPSLTEGVDEDAARMCGDSFGGSSQTQACGNKQGEDCCPVQRLANTLEGCRARGMATGIVVSILPPLHPPSVTLAWSISAPITSVLSC